MDQYQHCVALVRHERPELGGRQLTRSQSNVGSVPLLEFAGTADNALILPPLRIAFRKRRWPREHVRQVHVDGNTFGPCSSFNSDVLFR